MNFEILHSAGLNPARGYSSRLGGLPRAVGWATAWRASPTVEVSCVPMPLRAHQARWRVVNARSPHEERCGGTVVEVLVVASRQQGVAGELVGTTERAPSNKCRGGAHRGWRSTARRGGGSVRRRASGSSPEGGSAVIPASFWSCEGGRER
jgi:hypothetical protein